jgi:hypothetical protein
MAGDAEARLLLLEIFFLARTMGLMTGHTLQAFHWFMLDRRLRPVMAFKAQHAAFFILQIHIITCMRGMAKCAVPTAEWLMTGRGSCRLFFLRMAGKTEFTPVSAFFQKHLLLGIMRSVAPGACSLEKRLMNAAPAHIIFKIFMAGEA